MSLCLKAVLKQCFDCSNAIVEVQLAKSQNFEIHAPAVLQPVTESLEIEGAWTHVESNNHDEHGGMLSADHNKTM
tara:strand:+ start:2999 stop:3223 length:225 start_codon:yes stop_codon:yes gene_type:complete